MKLTTMRTTMGRTVVGGAGAGGGLLLGRWQWSASASPSLPGLTRERQLPVARALAQQGPRAPYSTQPDAGKGLHLRSAKRILNPPPSTLRVERERERDGDQSADEGPNLPLSLSLSLVACCVGWSAAATSRLVLTAAGPDRVGVTAAITQAVVGAQGNVDSGRLTSLGGDYCIHMLVSVPRSSEQAFRKEAQAAVGKFGGTASLRRVCAPASCVRLAACREGQRSC